MLPVLPIHSREWRTPSLPCTHSYPSAIVEHVLFGTNQSFSYMLYYYSTRATDFHSAYRAIFGSLTSDTRTATLAFFLRTTVSPRFQGCVCFTLSHDSCRIARTRLLRTLQPILRHSHTRYCQPLNYKTLIMSCSLRLLLPHAQTEAW